MEHQPGDHQAMEAEDEEQEAAGPRHAQTGMPANAPVLLQQLLLRYLLATVRREEFRKGGACDGIVTAVAAGVVAGTAGSTAQSQYVCLFWCLPCSPRMGRRSLPSPT